MEKPMKTIVAALLVSASTLAIAHGGGAPKHGGAVATASDLAFELAASGGNAVLYVEDHGKPLATAGMSGKLSVLNGADRAEAELKPAGDNKLEAKGVKVAKGTKSVATLTLPDKKEVTVRFSHR
jgi:hypothetical protein